MLYIMALFIGGWLRRKAVEWLMKDGAPEAVRVMEAAARYGDDDHLRFELLTALRQLVEQGNVEAQEALCRLTISQDLTALLRLAEQGNVEAQEALCRLAIFHDLPLARETALALSCAPRDASQRALFYFLTGQWDEYEGLDFDHSLLRVAYQAGDEKLRQRIGEQARGAGRVEWVEAVVGRRQGRQLGEMTDREWEVTLEVLSGSGRWAEMWRLAQEAPARWGARLLQRLSNAGWVPESDAVRAEYDDLARLAGRCIETGLDSLACCRAVLKGHKGKVPCLAISPDGRLLASGSSDKTVRLWNLADGMLLKTIEGNRPIRCLAISPDGQALAGGLENETVRLWSLPDGMPLRTLRGESNSEFSGTVKCIAFSPDGGILASGYGGDYPLRCWSMPDGAYLSSMENRSLGANPIRGVYSLAFSPDGQTLAICISDGFGVLWNLRNRECFVMGKKGPINAKILSFSPDGRTLVGAVSKTVDLWSLPDGMLQWRLPDDTTRYLPLKILEGHEGSITSLTISPDGRIIASGSEDCTMRLWSLPDGAPLKILKGHSGPVCSLAFSPDGQTLASACVDNVLLWSLNPFYRLPISQASPGDMLWAQETLRNGDLNAEERDVLELIAALISLRKRFEIQLEEPTRRIEAGEFDIEI